MAGAPSTGKMHATPRAAASGPTFLFPGTGTQSVGMGADVVARFPAASAVFERAAAVLGYDLAAVCFHGPAERLDQTVHAQPAIFVLSIACLEVLRAHGIRPAAVAGHSLGEWAALVAADVLSFEAALRLVRERAAAMQEIAERIPSAMTAVIGASAGVIDELCAMVRGQGVLAVVIRNAPMQLVISGETALVERAEHALAAAGATCARLETVNAFHTLLVSPVARRLAQVLTEIPFNAPRIPFCSNWSGDFMCDAETIRRSLVAQVTGPIDWVAVCQRLRAAGSGPFVEVGPRHVLSGLLRRIDRGAVCHDTSTAARMEQTIASLLRCCAPGLDGALGGARTRSLVSA
jgi:[acyl-carrier-protein] S-malonyltransferase